MSFTEYILYRFIILHIHSDYGHFSFSVNISPYLSFTIYIKMTDGKPMKDSNSITLGMSFMILDKLVSILFLTLCTLKWNCSSQLSLL